MAATMAAAEAAHAAPAAAVAAAEAPTAAPVANVPRVNSMLQWILVGRRRPRPLSPPNLTASQTCLFRFKVTGTEGSRDTFSGKKTPGGSRDTHKHTLVTNFSEKSRDETHLVREKGGISKGISDL